MAVLEHYNIRSTDMNATIRFYEDIIGLKRGPYPGREGMGCWIYDEHDVPIVHVINIAEGRDEAMIGFTQERLNKISPGARVDDHGSGAVDHVAFRCEDYDGFIERIEAAGHPYHTVNFPGFHLQQIFVNDPSGVTCELNFLRPEFEEGQIGVINMAEAK